MIKILFVCHGNICRSTMAQSIMSYLVKDNSNFYIDSAGISDEEHGNGIYPNARRELELNKIPVVEHHARKITKQDLEEFDYIICMEQRHIDNIKYYYGDSYNDKLRLLIKDYDISDPWYTRLFTDCFDEIYAGCNMLKDELDRR